MKKLKRIAAFALALALVICVCAIPASAVDYTATDNGYDKDKGYNWESSLTKIGNTVTARVVVNTNEPATAPLMLTGVVPAFLSAKLSGYVLYSGSDNREHYLDLYGEKYENFASTLTVFDSCNIPGDGKFLKASCIFKVMSERAGETLSF